jgi:hypothetical protein
LDADPGAWLGLRREQDPRYGSIIWKIAQGRSDVQGSRYLVSDGGWYRWQDLCFHQVRKEWSDLSLGFRCRLQRLQKRAQQSRFRLNQSCG